MEHARPHLTILVWKGFVKIGVRIRCNRRPEFLNPPCFRIEFDESAICSAPPAISEWIETAALCGHHVSAALQIEQFSGLDISISTVLPHIAGPLPDQYRPS